MGSFRTATLLAVAATTSLMLLGCGGGETPTPASTPTPTPTGETTPAPNPTLAPNPTPAPNPTASERFESRVTNLKEKNIDALTRDYQSSAGKWWYSVTTWTPQAPQDPNYPGGFSGSSEDFLREKYLDPFVKCNTGSSSSQPDVSVSKFHEGKGVGVLVFKSPCAVMSVETLVFNDAGIDTHFGFVADPNPTASLLGMGQDRVSDRVMGCDLSMTKKIIEASSSDTVTDMYSDDALLMFVDMRNASKEVTTYAGKSNIGKFFVAESSWLEQVNGMTQSKSTALAGYISTTQFECVDDSWSGGLSEGPQIWGVSFQTDGLVLFQTIVAYEAASPASLQDSFVF